MSAVSNFSFGRWTRVEQLPSPDIFSICKHGKILYAGGKNIIYVSNNKGQKTPQNIILLEANPRAKDTFKKNPQAALWLTEMNKKNIH